MIYFIAGMMPFFIMIWALSLVLYFHTLFLNEYPDKPNYAFDLIIPPIVILGVVVFLIILPIRTCINRCATPESPKDITYFDVFETFPSEYDTENPVTKKEGEIRLIELRALRNKDKMSA